MAVPLAIPHYTITHAFYETKHFVVSHGKRNSDGLPVILKFLKATGLSPPLSLRHEYDILQKIDSPHVLKAIDLQHYDHQDVLVFEDFQGYTLANILTKEKIDIKTFLMTAIELAHGLWEIHNLEIIHKNVNSKSILLNPFSKQIKICDFTVATFLPYTVQPLVSVSDLEGSLPYLSPEQTGRISRVIDYRTDIYSLGVTLYEILTGKLPFQAYHRREILELNLTSEPKPPHEIDPDIPEIISEIVMKCMEKEIEDRYHTALGLELDLSRCLNELTTEGEIETFAVDNKDFFNHFQIPQRLYEREATIGALLTAVERCCQNHSELLLVNGPSGVGKSSAVYEIQKTILKKKGFFIAGLFTQFTQTILYTGWKEALKQLIDLLLTESETEQDYWKQKLLNSVGNNGRLIANLLPELDLFIGELAEVESLDPQSAEVRFSYVFTSFIQTFLLTGRPLVIFLDNLHWADEHSLKLIHLLMSDKSIRNLLIIGAYTPQENFADSPLVKIIHKIKNAEADVETLEVNSLSPSGIAHLLIDTFNSTSMQVKALSEWMHQKTEGNPFFAIQLLRMFYREHLIQYIPSKQCWVEDFTKIKNLELPQTLPSFIAYALQRLSSTTRSILSLASVIGTTFDLQTLALLHKKSLPETAKDLWEALHEELILSQQSRFGLDFDLNRNGGNTTQISYSFLHSTIRFAAYHFLDSEKNREIHQSIGLLLLSSITGQRQRDSAECIVYHWNQGAGTRLPEQERETLAKLNLISGEKALNCGAAIPALHYFNSGIEILSQLHKAPAGSINYRLYRNKLGCEQIVSSWDSVEKTFQLALKHARNLEEQTSLYCSMITWEGENNNYHRTLELAKEALKLHRIHFKIPVSYAAVLYQRALVDTNAFFKDYKNIPISSDKKSMMITHIYRALRYSLIHMDPYTLEYLILKEIHAAFKYGLSGNTPIALMSRVYFFYGESQKAHEKGYELGEGVKKILNRFPKSKLTAQALALFYMSIVFWKQPLKEGHLNLIRMRQECLETGDVRYAIFCATALASLLLLRGDPLETVYKQIQTIRSDLAKYKASSAVELVFLDVCESLMGLSQNSMNPLLDEFDISFKSVALENSLPINLYTDYWKAFLLYLGDQFESVIALAKFMDIYASIYPSHIYWQSYYFYYALSLAAVSNINEKKERCKTTLTKLQRKIQIWANICPVNFLHKHLLLEAEIARLTNRNGDAAELYEKAIAAASKNEYLHEIAIANELAAKFYLQIDEKRIAAAYMRESYRLYGEWGSVVKLNLLKKKYPDLLVTIPSIRESDLEYSWTKPHISTMSTTPSSSSEQNLDVNFIIQTTQMISQEIALNPLLTKFLQMIDSRVQAEHYFLFLSKGQSFVVYAEMHKDQPVPQFEGQITSKLLPLTIIKEVLRSKKEFLLSDAAFEGDFKNDPYILSKSVRSILCMPLIHRGKFKAILYLENRTMKNAFSLEDVNFLSLLCAQMAISIENAFLYGELDKKVQERTKKLTLLQGQLLQQEKMASLGLLTAGIAHEIKNPLNIIINFSELSREIIKDLKQLLESLKNNFSDDEKLNFEETIRTIQSNLKTINEQGNRADSIVKKMSEHGAGKPSKMTPTDIRQLLDETIALSYHSMRARDAMFNITIEKKLDQSIDILQIAPQEISRVILNLLNNSYYAVVQKKKMLGDAYTPLVRITTLNLGHEYEIRIRDNGIGIPTECIPKIFTPFFTTKPESEGTGLGLILSQNIIVQQHGGTIAFDTKEGEFTEFIIRLPLSLSKTKIQ